MPRPLVSIESGNRPRFLAARNKLVEEHMHMVPPIADLLKRRLPPSFPLDDLVSEGYIGLLQAATRYRPRKHNGTPFSAFARLRIHGAMVDSIRRKNYLEGTQVPIRAEAIPIEVPNFEGSIDGARALDKLNRAIAAMPEHRRRVVGAWYHDSNLGNLKSIWQRSKRAREAHAAAIEQLRRSFEESAA